MIKITEKFPTVHQQSKRLGEQTFASHCIHQLGSFHVKVNKMEPNNQNIPEIELIIKASTIDGRRKGACIFCQEYFMDLYLLAEMKNISLKITTVDMKRPPPDFR